VKCLELGVRNRRVTTATPRAFAKRERRWCSLIEADEGGSDLNIDESALNSIHRTTFVS
jgi:hypothetical protein